MYEKNEKNERNEKINNTNVYNNGGGDSNMNISNKSNNSNNNSSNDSNNNGSGNNIHNVSNINSIFTYTNTINITVIKDKNHYQNEYKKKYIGKRLYDNKILEIERRRDWERNRRLSDQFTRQPSGYFLGPAMNHSRLV